MSMNNKENRHRVATHRSSSSSGASELLCDYHPGESEKVTLDNHIGDDCSIGDFPQTYCDQTLGQFEAFSIITPTSVVLETFSTPVLVKSNINTFNDRGSREDQQVSRNIRLKAFGGRRKILKNQLNDDYVDDEEDDNDQLRGLSMNRASSRRTMLICLSIMIVMLCNSTPAESVDCFKCSSRNGSNPACEDPFHNLNTTRITSPVLPDPPPNVAYHTPCYAGKKGRDGLFPASACIKLTGTFARMSHCGKFNFDGDSLKGCVLACPEDACNSAPPSIILAGGKPLSQLAAALLAPLLSALALSILSLSDATIQLIHC